MEEMKTRLSESQKINTKLQEQLEKANKARSQERNGLNQLNEQQKQEISLLRRELDKVNNLCDNLRDTTKKADAEITSYKKEHDIEFNTLKKALEDSRKINESLKERLRERRDFEESRTSFADRTTSPSRTDISQLRNELADKSGMIESLNSKLQKYEEVMANQLQKDLGGKDKNSESNLESPGLADESNVTDRLSSFPSKSKVIRLEKELAESQKIILTLRKKLEIEKDDKQGQTSFDKSHSTATSSDAVDGLGTDERKSGQLQKELEDVYKKNEELRKAVSENITLADMNRQLKEDLTTSKQKCGVLEKEIANYAKKVKDTNSEVSRLADELTRTRTLNSDYVSQLKALRLQHEQTTKFREEAVNARSMNDKLSAQVQKLVASLESAGKENER
jgi:chromosome segregation ATPase